METEVAINGADLGGSLPVENVQELASNCSKEIPHRYIRPEMILDEISTDDPSQVPVIDMEKLATSHSKYQNEMAKLHQACKEWGFFQVNSRKFCILPYQLSLSQTFARHNFLVRNFARLE